MTISNGIIQGFAAGDDIEITRALSIPSGTLISSLWFTVKRNYHTTDAQAIISKLITNVEGANGVVTSGNLSIKVSRIETALLTPLSEYPYSIKMLLDNNTVITSELGVIIALPAVKQGDT